MKMDSSENGGYEQPITYRQITEIQTGPKCESMSVQPSKDDHINESFIISEPSEMVVDIKSQSDGLETSHIQPGPEHQGYEQPIKYRQNMELQLRPEYDNASPQPADLQPAPDYETISPDSGGYDYIDDRLVSLHPTGEPIKTIVLKFSLMETMQIYNLFNMIIILILDISTQEQLEVQKPL